MFGWFRGFFSKGDFALIDFAEDLACLGGDCEMGFAFGELLAQIGEQHEGGRFRNLGLRSQIIFVEMNSFSSLVLRLRWCSLLVE